MTNETKGLKAEANDEPIEVLFGEHVFIVPAPLDWPWETMDHLAEGRISKAVAELLGDEQLEVFRSTKPRMRDAVAFMEAVAAASGSGELGN
jgi:hypothetical protein